MVKIFMFFYLEVDNFQLWYLCVIDFQIKVERLPLGIGHAPFLKEWLLEIIKTVPFFAVSLYPLLFFVNTPLK